jgi:Zn-finger nucleic acid-binding protein
MKLPLQCPDCKAPLHPFRAVSPQGVDVELECCSRCGGVWGADGRLQESFGPVARPQLVGGTTHRRCAFCRILLTPAVLPGGLSVEMCSACRGLYLDQGEFQKLGGRTHPPPRASGLPPPPQEPTPRPAPARRARVTTFEKAPAPTPTPAPLSFSAPATSEQAPSFICVQCGQPKPLREGQAFRQGLACRPCMRALLGG